MKKTFLKNLLRDIKKSLSRFLSIVVIIAVGVAFYAGVRATSPSMKISADTYFQKKNFMDFKLISTLGLTKDDVTEIQKISGITKAEGSYSIDAVVERNKRQLVLNVNALPKENEINDVKIIKGRKPEASNEAIVEDRFLENYKLSLGDTILLKSGSEKSLEDSLKSAEFKIVGTAQSPLYVSEQRQPSSVGNGIVKGFAYILPEVFKSEVYTEIYVRTASSESKNSLLDNKGYSSYIEGIEKTLKDIGVSRNEIRYAEVFGKANDKLNEAQAELDKSRKEAEEKFADGYKQLEEARNKLSKGWEDLRKNETLFNKKMEDSAKQLEQGKSQLKAAEAEIGSRRKKLENAKLMLGKENPQIIAGEAELNKGEAELEVNRKKLESSELELNKGKKQGLAELSSARKKLEDGQKEIDENTEKLKVEEEKANVKLKDGEAEIQKNRDKLKEIKKPEWYVLGRTKNAGYETYRQDSDRIDSIGKAFPLIFFLVASLVSLTTMTRMVQEKRIEVGTFKALGYSRAAIVSHYLIYALSASLIGSLIGIFVGFRLFPSLIMNAYASRYAIGEQVVPFNTVLALQSAVIAVLFTAAAAIVSTLDELREVPASLMRPKPPKSGKRILLERIDFIWKRLNFTRKVAARNIFRYKQRLFMTVIGIAACTGLMITGFGLREGIVGATENQFSSIYKYDMQGTLSKNINQADKNFTKAEALKTNNVKAILFSYLKNTSVKMEDDKSQDAYVVVPENKDELNSYINLSMKGKEVKLEDNGVVITEKLSKLLDKKAGETIEITLEDKVFEAKISGVTEHYIQHYIYMSPAYYETITGKTKEFNSFYGLLNNLSEEEEDKTQVSLKNIGEINSVEFKNNIHTNFNKITGAVNSVIPVLIVSAGVLAFVVIYNLTNINIAERMRELATIKLLGFYNKELALYIYRENMLLTFLGSLMGIPVGMLLNKFIMATAETNDLMFFPRIGTIYYVVSILLTLLFSVIVNLAMYSRFDRINMIESLKSAE